MTSFRLRELAVDKKRFKKKRLKKRYKDTLKAFMENCDIDLENWENITANRSAWQSQVSIGADNMQDIRSEEAVQRRVICKAKAMLPMSDD